jgi:hypothetical protein
MRLKVIALVVLLLLVFLSLEAAVTYTTVNRNFLKGTDLDNITNATAVNTYATNKDAIASSYFDGNKVCGKVFSAVATVTGTIDGTSINHLTPVIQGSTNNSTWADIATLEAYSSSAVTIGTAWLIIADLSDIWMPYIRVVYVYHTSANANISDATNIGGVKTELTVYGK